MTKLAYCGLDCDTCPAFCALRDNDDKLREKTAAEWSKMFSADIKKEDINCVGCTAEQGIHFSHCHECKSRDCARSKNLENCGKCSDYPCQDLRDFFKYVPEAKAVLDGINSEDHV